MINNDFLSIQNISAEQRKQLQSYFIEIGALIQLILMSSLVTNQDLILTITKLTFIPATKIINHPLNIFLESPTCNTTLFSNIIKSLTQQNIHIINYYYKIAGLNPNIFLHSFITKNIEDNLSQAHNNVQTNFIADVSEYVPTES